MIIYKHYLTVQPWTLDFSINNIMVNSVVAWVRFSGLPIQYYHKSILHAIVKVVGIVMKVDYNTKVFKRGKFARLAIALDLTKPLVPKLWVDEKLQKVEYEGLPLIYFECGCYDHLRKSYLNKTCNKLRPDGEDIHATENQAPSPTTLEEKFDP